MIDLTASRVARQTACAQSVEGHLFGADYACTRCGLTVVREE